MGRHVCKIAHHDVVLDHCSRIDDGAYADLRVGIQNRRRQYHGSGGSPRGAGDHRRGMDHREEGEAHGRQGVSGSFADGIVTDAVRDPHVLPALQPAAVAEDGVHTHDFHATLLHLMGLDHEKLTFRYSGRDFRLTDVAGDVVKEILA